MTISEEILKDTKEFALRFLKEMLPHDLYFHNLVHTKEVVEAVIEIGTAEGLSSAELIPVEIAAWFHDVGYCFCYKGHEDKSKETASAYLKSKNYSPDDLEIVLSCIEATRYPQNPQSLEAQIICDADFYHFSCLDYERHEKSLRREWEIYLKKSYSDKDWWEENCKMLSDHSYFTTYGKIVLQEKKELNLSKMRCSLEY